ncbi:MAG TPA: 30S ribosomal protein S20 [Acidimicrobiales bacterium]|nr:30S ribosomal protein S20 [Acidimicrobiales bacterium]
MPARAYSSTPAHGSCTQRTPGPAWSAARSPSVSVGLSHTTASASAGPTISPPAAVTAVTTQSGAAPGPRAIRGATTAGERTDRAGNLNPFMANIKSQIKRNKQNEVRRVRNKAVRSEVKTRIKTATTALATGAETSGDALKTAVKRLDKAAAKGVIHKNQAANRKSALMRQAAKASGGPATATTSSEG